MKLPDNDVDDWALRAPQDTLGAKVGERALSMSEKAWTVHEGARDRRCALIF